MTLRAARESLTATLVALNLSGVTVLGFEPTSLTRGITVTVASTGMESVEWVLTIRVYVNGIQTEEAQDLLDDTVSSVDSGMVSVPRTSWTFGWDALRNAYVATTTAMFPRDDF
jgi:hypothetical protein